jgi:hypothetical protein
MYSTRLWQMFRSLMVFTLALILGAQPNFAQTHVVSRADLQAAIVAAASARQDHLRTVESFLSTPSAEKALRTVSLELKDVKTAVSSLSDQELARLAAQAEKAQADFAAGRISDRDLLIILIGLAALILIIVAVR